MRLNQVTVSVQDLQRSIPFYQGLGLLLIVQNEGYARFVCPEGGSTFSLHLAQSVPQTDTVIYFEDRELDATYERLRQSGYVFEQPPTDQPWRWRESYLKDPDGNTICLYHAGTVRLYPPWRLPESLPPSPRVDALDHLVLTVSNIDQTVSFYERVLGMQVRRFGAGRVALHFGDQKINLHPKGVVTDPNVRHATPGSADLCLLTGAPIQEWQAHLLRQGVSVLEGPCTRTGARGPIRSLYFYDPDENLIEVASELDG